MNRDNQLRQPVTVSDQKLAERCALGRVVVIDDEPDILSALTTLIEMEGYACEPYPSALAYLQVLNYNRPCFPGPCCVLCDVVMPELDGLELQSRLATLDDTPLLLMSGASGAEEAAHAFRAGAMDFLVKPIKANALLAAIAKALAASTERQQRHHRKRELAARIGSLTERERDVARRVAAGQTNPEIAAAYGISIRTVKLYRHRALEKLGVSGTVDLVRVADEGGL